MEDQLTTMQAAQFLGVSAIRIRQFIAMGRLAAHKHGRDYVILRSDLEACIRFPVGRPRVQEKAARDTAPA